MFFAPLVLAALPFSASAGLIPRQSQTPCSFVMNAAGLANGSVQEDHVGESRIGGTYPQGTYYIVNGTLYDSENHNCIIQPSSRQLQCVAGALGIPTTFSFADDGNLLHNGTESWKACKPEGPDDGSYNIFSDEVTTAGCDVITLRTGGFNCTALGRPDPTSTVSSSSTVAPVSSTAPTASCPTDISGGVYQNPHLIVPVSQNASSHAFGNQYNATISPVNSTLFNFDIPSSAPYTGTCALIFTFPYGAANYYSGIEEEQGEMGGLDFALLNNVAHDDTTYDTMGSTAADYGKVETLPGSNYLIHTGSCYAGATLTYAVSSRGNVELDFPQWTGGIGLWIVPCA